MQHEDVKYLKENQDDFFQEQENESVENNSDDKRSKVAGFFLGLFDLVKTIVLIVVLTYVIRLFLIQPFIVDGQSMEPSFHNNDYLITEKVSFKIRSPERGEIVIIHPPDNPEINYIKRIVGLPGDTIQVKDGFVYANHKRLDESYLPSGDITATNKENYSIILKDKEYFVMGDNRNHSRDSREIGPIPYQNIVSRIWLRLLPFNQIKAFASSELFGN